MKNLIFVIFLLHSALAAPQLISFKDGKVGVNFLGYHAEAGLGGGQNGQNGGLLGGLHASAGTPWGQNAAAGLGGNINGRAAGVLYAGAQATPDVGASALLGGDTSQGGFSGSEAYANGRVNSHTKTIVTGNTQKGYEQPQPQYPPHPIEENVNAIQKIRPPKKYHSSDPYNFTNRADYSFDSSVAFNTNKTKTIYDNQENKPATVTSIVFTKTINRNTFGTPYHTNGNHHSIAGANDNNQHNHFNNNKSNITPSITPSSISLNHSLNDDNNNPTAILITKDKTKIRTYPHRQRRNRHQKRINANRQRQRSKTIFKVVEQKNELQQPAPRNQYNNSTEEFNIDEQEERIISNISKQQQHLARRQLIASPPIPHELPACDSNKQECKNIHREVRSDVVQNALQIPIGILQSLQHSLGNLGSK